MADKGYLKYVNTRMGSRNEPRFSNGNTLPFAQRPFGMAGFVLQTGSLIDRCEYFYDPDAYAFEGFASRTSRARGSATTPRCSYSRRRG